MSEMGEKCPDCKSAKIVTGWATGTIFAVMFGLATVLYQQVESIRQSENNHEQLQWHPGAGEGLAKLETRLAGVIPETRDRFRRQEWVAWLTTYEREQTDRGARISIQETRVGNIEVGLARLEAQIKSVSGQSKTQLESIKENVDGIRSNVERIQKNVVEELKEGRERQIMDRRKQEAR